MLNANWKATNISTLKIHTVQNIFVSDFLSLEVN